jgi:hypothetical protein
MSEYQHRVSTYRIAARIMAHSCESCEQREFDYLIEDAFVCETCAYWKG